MTKVTFVSGLDNMSYVNFDGAVLGPKNIFNGTTYIVPELINEKIEKRNYLIRDFDSTKVKFPKSDVVFNLINNPERNLLSLRRLNFISKHLKTPLINPPDAVFKSRRDNIAVLAEGLDDLIVPKTIKTYLSSPESLRDVIQKENIGFPFLIRPIWTHGGQGLVKVENGEQISKMRFGNNAMGLFYLSEFFDYKKKAGLYQKIRMFIIDGEIYPRHAIQGETWNVHMATRREKMLGDEKLTAAEEKFLKNFNRRLTKKKLTALKTFSERLGLDYFGIDGAIAEDGRFIIFEANSAMDAFRQGMRESFPYLESYIDNIRNAVEDLILTRAASQNSNPGKD